MAAWFAAMTAKIFDERVELIFDIFYALIKPSLDQVSQSVSGFQKLSWKQNKTYSLSVESFNNFTEHEKTCINSA